MVLSDIGFDSSESASASTEEIVPLFHQEHSHELIEGGTEDTNQPQETARFVYKKTRELLPVPFRGRSRLVAEALIQTANDYQMDPLFLMAIISQESQFNPLARGSHGEIGLMQLKPSTAMTVASLSGLTDEQALAEVSEALKDPVQNIRLGAAYLARLRVSFRNRSTLYISAYNMGATGVRTHVALGLEPRVYSSKVLAHYVELSGAVQTVASITPTKLVVFRRTLDL